MQKYGDAFSKSSSIYMYFRKSRFTAPFARGRKTKLPTVYTTIYLPKILNTIIPQLKRADVFSKARHLNFGMSLHLHPYFAYVSSEGYLRGFAVYSEI